MIKTVIRANNNMVITFDEKGRQMPEYQGQYEDMKRKVMEDNREETAFIHCSVSHRNRILSPK